MVRTIVPIVFALIFAAGLWVVVSLSGEVQTTIRIPLAVDLPEGRAASSSMPRTLSATVRGPGWTVVQFALLGKPMCRVDLNQQGTQEERLTITRRMMLQAIAPPQSLTLSDIEPDSIHVALDALRDRMVPIVPAVHVICRRGFEQTEPARVDPDSIRITGAGSVVSRIAAWSTRTITINGATKPVRLEVALSDSLSDLISISPQPVVVSVDVQETAERSFAHIPIHLINVPTGAHYRLEPSIATVRIRGGVETLAALHATDVKATVDYFTLMENMPNRATVEISGPPHTVVMQQEPHTVGWFQQATP